MFNKPIRVGLLAYGAIGYEHNLAVQNTDGLVLSAVCDTKPERIAAARELATKTLLASAMQPRCLTQACLT